MPKRLKPLHLLLLLCGVFFLQACVCVYGVGIFENSDKVRDRLCQTLQFTAPSQTTDLDGVVHFAWNVPPRAVESRTITIYRPSQISFSGGVISISNGASPTPLGTWQTNNDSLDIDVSVAALGGDTDRLSVALTVDRTYLVPSMGSGLLSETVTCAVLLNITRTVAPPPPPAMQCANFHFTSPRGGLLNAVNTFYWDPIPQAASYQINVYSGGTRIASWNADGAATSLQGDASGNAIGGANPFIVEAIAFDAYGQSCKDTVQMDREWLAPPPPPSLIEPPLESTPTCEENPDAPYCG